jgi:hypothetical protein
MITDKKEQKKYIIRNWTTSSGERITEMLRRYWNEGKVDSYDFIKQETIE